MSATLESFLRSWPYDPWLDFALLVTWGVYLRGWLALRRRDPARWQFGRLTAFTCGLVAVFLALASPIEPFAALLLQVHMAQHLLLMMVAPPLIWLGAPLFPLLRGSPATIRHAWLLPLLRQHGLRKFSAALTHPFAALPLFVGVTLFWHTPRMYELALRDSAWHVAEHACFLAAGLVFWYPVVRPYPSRPRWSPWLLLPYLILADVQNTVLAAWLTFSGTVLYPHYTQVPRLAGLSALNDQAAAGVLMWVPGSVAFLAPLFWIGVRLLTGSPAKQQDTIRQRSATLRIASLHAAAYRQKPGADFDLLRVPLLGSFLSWRHGRKVLQILLTLAAGLIVYDGLCGPQLGAMNLAGVLPWVHWRGFLVLGLLAAGNFFCLACPFTLPRSLAGRWFRADRAWPRCLRGKWTALTLLILFLWAYEIFALWDSPWWTAWITLGYFLAAFVIDSLFRGAAFCKYVCPIGQFNFVSAMVSPLEVKVRDPQVCASCTTIECIRGSDSVPGCGLELFQPRKQGNLDCTFCLDCAHACPHENVGILAVTPTAQLWSDRARSGVGRFSQRPDLAALVLILTFGAFINAAGMVGPVLAWQDRISALLGQSSRYLAVSLFTLLGLVVVPILIVSFATELSRRWGRLSTCRLELASRFAWAFVPLGFSMWLAHYGFHLLTGWETIVPVSQRLIGDLGWTALGPPEWSCACCRPLTDWLLRLELLSLDVGLLASLYAAWRIAGDDANESADPRAACKVAAPWVVALLLLFAIGVWIVFQPMEMRGTLSGETF